ncbi:OsmC family protein [Robertkochia solimangrovi]|uniref:OsmC family protein n=1 Tax=Robertkochia solimangrovi TaxID=2213046 RepID=UPI00117C488B|nr:OsmC family protein [Robertkochia solimangrovi]TRZ44307.1 OsmC family peroxiredoxin [Robertkochia solimangrovi]
MKIHNYKITTQWTGNKGYGTADYRSYSRNHLISCEGKAPIEGSSDPAFMGDPLRYNPEEMFVSSLSACHMLWYLHLCSSNGITVTEYTDEAQGIMTEEESGSGRFTKVVLHPVVTIAELDKQELALRLHTAANEKCFIANSCNFKVVHEPTIKTA